jgi:hypothetical protein
MIYWKQYFPLRPVAISSIQHTRSASMVRTPSLDLTIGLRKCDCMHRIQQQTRVHTGLLTTIYHNILYGIIHCLLSNYGRFVKLNQQYSWLIHPTITNLSFQTT